MAAESSTRTPRAVSAAAFAQAAQDAVRRMAQEQADAVAAAADLVTGGLRGRGRAGLRDRAFAGVAHNDALEARYAGRIRRPA
jgi:hypothetical protein